MGHDGSFFILGIPDFANHVVPTYVTGCTILKMNTRDGVVKHIDYTVKNNIF